MKNKLQMFALVRISQVVLCSWPALFPEVWFCSFLFIFVALPRQTRRWPLAHGDPVVEHCSAPVPRSETPGLWDFPCLRREIEPKKNEGKRHGLGKEALIWLSWTSVVTVPSRAKNLPLAVGARKQDLCETWSLACARLQPHYPREARY